MFETTVSLIALLLIFLAPIILSTAIVSQLQYTNTAIRIVAISVITCFIITSEFLLLASLNLFTLSSCIVASLLMIPLSRFLAVTKIVRGDLKVFFRDYLTLILLLISLCALSISFARAILMPPLSWDSYTYHLFFPALWIQNSGFRNTPLPEALEFYYHFPMNGEVLISFLMLPFSSDLLTNLLNFPFFFALLIGTYTLSKELGLKTKWGIIAAILYCFSPMNYAFLTTSYVTIILQFYLLSSVLFTLRAWRYCKISDYILAFFSIMLAFGTKLTSLMYLPFFGLILLSSLIANLKIKKLSSISITWTLVVILIGSLVGGGWYFRNYIEKQNFFYPYYVSQFFKSPKFQNNVARIHQKKKIKKDSPHIKDNLKAIQNLFFYVKENSLSAGPKYLVFILFALLLGFKKNKICKNKEYYFLILTATLPILFFFTSGAEQIQNMRTSWINYNARLLSHSFLIYTMLALLYLQKIKLEKYLLWGSLGLFSLDLYHLNLEFLDFRLGFVLACTIPIAVLIFFAVKAYAKRTCLIFCAALCCLLGVSIALNELKSYRKATRELYIKEHRDLLGQIDKFAELFTWSHTLKQPSKIAYYKAKTYSDHTSFLYPLMGENLQHKVVPLLPNKDLTPSPEHMHKELYEQKIQYVLIQKPFQNNQILKILHANPKHFKLLEETKIFKVFIIVN